MTASVIVHVARAVMNVNIAINPDVGQKPLKI